MSTRLDIKEARVSPPPVGTYSVKGKFATTAQRFIGCRDFFHKQFQDVQCRGRIFFATDQPENVANLLWYVERVLNISPRYRSRMKLCKGTFKYPNNKVRILHIHLSHFWMQHLCRFSFLSAVLRAGHRHADKPCGLDQLMRVYYFQRARRATALFLYGRTWLNEELHSAAGWIANFNTPNKAERLVRPPTRRRKHFSGKMPRCNLNVKEKQTLESWVNKGEQSRSYSRADGYKVFAFPVRKMKVDKPVRAKAKPCLQKKEVPLPKDMGMYSVDGQYRTKNATDWHTCREEFHFDLQNCKPNKSKRIAIYYGTSKPEALARLVRFVEARLNLRYSQRTRVYVCREKPIEGMKKKKFRVVYVETSPFWVSDKARSQFFTILLRASRNGNWKKPWTNPLDVLLQEKYLRETAVGTAMFLCGRTELNSDHFDGWVNGLGAGWDYSHLCQVLVKPTKSQGVKFFRDKHKLSRLTKAERAKLRSWAKEQGTSAKDLRFIPR